MSDSKQIDWPDLSSFCYVKGRSATEEDINAGCAVFMLQSEDGQLNGRPMDIDIPQYAIHINEESGEETPGVIIQAEEAAHGPQAIGFVPLNSSEFQVGLLQEFRLLGTSKP